MPPVMALLQSSALEIQAAHLPLHRGGPGKIAVVMMGGSSQVKELMARLQFVSETVYWMVWSLI